jgi:hypothetical protein
MGENRIAHIGGKTAGAEVNLLSAVNISSALGVKFP